MGDVAPIRGGHIPVAQRVSDLPIVNDVDDMLREGLSAPDVAKHIQQTFELLVDIPERTLVEALTTRRASLPPPPPTPEEWPAAFAPPAEQRVAPRSPGRLSSGMYRQAARGINALLETESLYLAQRDRIDMLMHLEHSVGVPYEEMPREMNSALEMLKTHAKLQEQFGPAIDRMKMSLEIQGGSATGLGQRIMSVMQDPESRHKVLAMFKRLVQAANMPVIDAEAEPVGNG